MSAYVPLANGANSNTPTGLQVQYIAGIETTYSIQLLLGQLPVDREDYRDNQAADNTVVHDGAKIVNQNTVNTLPFLYSQCQKIFLS